MTTTTNNTSVTNIPTFSNRFLVFGVGLNDSQASGSSSCPYYAVWHSMLSRCYSAKTQAKNPAYIGCTVSDEWLRFSNFKKWMMEQTWEGLQIDKDILVLGNKVYSADTCLFVTREVNTLIRKNRGKYALGVTWVDTIGKFKAACTIHGSQKTLGYYLTEDEAAQVYLVCKKEVIKIVASKQTNEKVRKRLLEIADEM